MYQTAATATRTVCAVKVLYVPPAACAWMVNAFVAVIPTVQIDKLVQMESVQRQEPKQFCIER